MRRFLLGICGLLLSVQAVSAQANLFNWTGFYVGLSAGWADIKSDGLYTLPPSDRFNTAWDSPIAAAHIGFQNQMGNWVFGLEAAASLLDKREGQSFSPSADCLGATPVADRTCITKINNLITAGARIGTANGPWLLYATAGYAAGQLQPYTRITSTGAFALGTEKIWHHGWYAGVGMDVMLAPNWIFGLEYQYVDLASRRHEASNGDPADARSVDAVLNIIRARLTLLFSTAGG